MLVGVISWAGEGMDPVGDNNDDTIPVISSADKLSFMNEHQQSMSSVTSLPAVGVW